MTETTVEKKVRNKAGSIIMLVFAGILVLIIGLDFYKLFHANVDKSIWIKVRQGYARDILLIIHFHVSLFILDS